LGDGFDSAYEGRSKKEIIRLERERKALEQNLVGIKDMPGLPTSSSPSTPAKRRSRFARPAA
jgi:hypothetical protein